jgi:hypothetical protein
VISPVDPCSAWTAKANKRVQFGYGLNYLIDIAYAVIVDVEATPARTYDEVAATKTIIKRTDERLGLKPERLAAVRHWQIHRHRDHAAHPCLGHEQAGRRQQRTASQGRSAVECGRSVDLAVEPHAPGGVSVDLKTPRGSYSSMPRWPAHCPPDLRGGEVAGSPQEIQVFNYREVVR